MQTGTDFTGTVVSGTQTCTGGGSTTSYDLTGAAIGGGQISGSSISFTTEGCTYSGSITGSPANRLAGSETCVVPYGGTSYTFTGTWQGTKQLSVVSLAEARTARQYRRAVRLVSCPTLAADLAADHQLTSAWHVSHRKDTMASESARRPIPPGTAASMSYALAGPAVAMFDR